MSVLEQTPIVVSASEHVDLCTVHDCRNLSAQLKRKIADILVIGSTWPDNVSTFCDAAHECNLEARNAQYLRICQSVFARSTSTCSCVQPTTLADEMDHKYPGLTSNLVEKSDVVVWLGDLNYRVELPRCAVQDLLKHKMQEVNHVWFWCFLEVFIMFS